MLFDFFKKLFGYADERSKLKRKAIEDNFERDRVCLTPKRFKTTCNIPARPMEDYFDIDDSDDDDIVFLSEQKCSAVKSCTKLNGTHMKQQPQSYNQCHASPVYKPICSPFMPHQSINHKSPMRHSMINHKHRMQDHDHKCPTLCKTNQLKERHQYQELLHNFLPNRVHLKHKGAENAYMHKPIEVIDLEKRELEVATPANDKSRSVSINSVTLNQCNTSFPCRGNLSSSYSRLDKAKVPTLDRNKKDITKDAYLEAIRMVTNDKPSVTSTPKPKSPVKAVATNSLREELAAKAVMRQDFIPQVTKRYNERIEQRHREAEELKKMTCVLSKHNRYAREAALEEQLARSMRLCLAVLDDREEPEEPALPTLTDMMLREVRSALVPCPPDEVLAEGFGLRITRKDIHTLAGLNWLNDEVINFYMNLLIARGSASNKYPKVHAMNTFFYPKLLLGGQSSLRRWTRKVDIFAQDLIVVPVHLDIHWCMSIIDFRDKSIVYYDSMGGSNSKCLAALKQYLQDESKDKKKQAYDMSDWTFQSAKNIPQQMNGSDCGMFSCMFAEYVCANKKITFTQDDMPYFRNKMVYEILKGKLL